MNNTDLMPYLSVGSNEIPFGTKIEIKQLIGLKLPGSNSKVHNGCVTVQDKSQQKTSNGIDLFVGRHSYYLELKNVIKEGSIIEWEEKDCEI